MAQKRITAVFAIVAMAGCGTFLSSGDDDDDDATISPPSQAADGSSSSSDESSNSDTGSSSSTDEDATDSKDAATPHDSGGKADGAEPCVPFGSPCSGTQTCCASGNGNPGELVCREGNCGACTANGQMCKNATECCKPAGGVGNSLCVGSLCCFKLNTPCTPLDECCDGFTCSTLMKKCVPL